ncbi:MAG: Fe-Mn family superoxide dismutase [Candidatus Aenigmatarchaeota archaeon]
MAFEPKNFDSLIGTKGFSDQLLKNHFTLYQGYVANTNKLGDALSAFSKDGKFGAEFAELKRRFGWEFSGMRLHELYFGNITKNENALDKNSEFAKQIAKDFGSYDNWEKDFKATGAMRGIGWVALYYDSASEKFFNVWINEHDAGHLAGAVPLLVMDVFEHAFMIDYGLKRADYIEAFFKAIDWSAVSKRFETGK